MKQRDIDLLSSYLDGQLSSSESTRLEARLRTDPDLRSVLQDLRGARSLLRQLPMRKAPRNFTLTPKMVGKNPPLPRSYPIFKFAATLATIMLFFTFGLNFMGAQLASQPPAALGMGGGAPDQTFAAESALVTEPPAAEMPAATEAPVEEPSVAMVPMSTETALAEDATRIIEETAVTKQGDAENAQSGGVVQEPPQALAETVSPQPVSSAWQWLLAGVAVLSLFVMALMRQLATSRWRSKS